MLFCLLPPDFYCLRGVPHFAYIRYSSPVIYPEIAEELALPPVKIHCSVLAEDAIHAAIEDYKGKHD